MMMRHLSTLQEAARSFTRYISPRQDYHILCIESSHWGGFNTVSGRRHLDIICNHDKDEKQGKNRFLCTLCCENRLPVYHRGKQEILIRSLCERKHLNEAVDILFRMETPPSNDMYTFLLRACNKSNALPQAKRIQEHLETHQGHLNGLICNYLVVTLAKCGDIENAYHIFVRLSYRTVFSWTAIISVYVDYGRSQEALEMYQHMLNDGIKPDNFTFAALFKACGSLGNLTHGRVLHGDAHNRGHISDVFVQNTLVAMYGKCGAISDAEYVFGRLGGRDLISWNAMLKAYVEQGRSRNALLLYRQMIDDGVAPDKHSLMFALQACGILAQNQEQALRKDSMLNRIVLEIGKAFDADARTKNISFDVFVCTAMLSMYGKLGAIREAENVFSMVIERDVVLWNALLSVYINEYEAIRALILYAHMQKEGMCGDQLTFSLAFQACGILAEGKEEILNRSEESTKEMCLEIGKALHNDAGIEGFTLNAFSGNTLVTMYAKCGAIVEARDAFSSLLERDAVSWNVMLSAFIEHGEGEKALKLYRQAHQDGIIPDQCMFISAIQACCVLCDMENTLVLGREVALEIGQALHADARNRSFSEDVYLNTTLCSMYGKCGAICKAEHIINGLHHRDTVSWNALLSAYVDHGKGERTLHVYKEMLEGVVPDRLSFICAFQACCILAEEEGDIVGQKNKMTKVSCLQIGKALHEDAHRMGYTSDILVATAIMNMYGKCDSVIDLENTFSLLSCRDLVSWNAMLSVLGDQGRGERVLHLYQEMQNLGVLANDITLLSVLHACRETGSLEICKHIHFCITSTGFDGTPALSATLIHAYGCCSSIEDTKVLFDFLCAPDSVSWTAYISALAIEGNSLACKYMFLHLKLVGITPDKVLFTSVLSACSRTGLVLEAIEYFESMMRDHGLRQNLKHYSIMLEVLGRAGDFKRLENLLANMPMKADLTIWLCLLGACNTHGNLEMAKQVFDHALDMHPQQATAYVMMANIYAEAEGAQCS